MKKLSLIFLSLTLLFVSSGFTDCPFKKSMFPKKDLWGQTFEIKNRGFTPKGANLWKQEGTTITGDDITAVDDGLTRLFDKCKCQISEHDGLPFSKAVTHAEYIVAILKSTDLDSNGDPAIRIPAAQYKGSIYDKGGYILIAGQMLALGVPYGNVMAIPDHQSNFARVSLIAEFEGEHIVAGHNAPTVYYANETHSQGNGHPFISNCKPQTEAQNLQMEAKKSQVYAVGTYDTPYGKSLILLTK